MVNWGFCGLWQISSLGRNSFNFSWNIPPWPINFHKEVLNSHNSGRGSAHWVSGYTALTVTQINLHSYKIKRSTSRLFILHLNPFFCNIWDGRKLHVFCYHTFPPLSLNMCTSAHLALFGIFIWSVKCDHAVKPWVGFLKIELFKIIIKEISASVIVIGISMWWIVIAF